MLRPGVRLSPRWSVAFPLQYQGLEGVLGGVRWTADVEATFHPVGGLVLGLGVGYSGMLATRRDPVPVFAALRADVPESTLRECDGDGLGGQVRAAWLVAVGESFATGPTVAAELRWTRCREVSEETTFVVDEGVLGVRSVPTEATEWWRHSGLAAGWTLAWR